MTVIISFQNDGYDYHFGKEWRRAFANDGHFFIFGMRFIFYHHHQNDGHNSPLRSAIREPSHNMYLPFAILPSKTDGSRFEPSLDNGAIYKLLAFFSAVYILFAPSRRPAVAVNLLRVQAYIKFSTGILFATC